MAKITIQKKEKKNYQNLLAEILEFQDFISGYPVRSDEEWRRFDPSKLLEPIWESSQKGTGFSNVAISENPDNIEIKSLTNWQKSDEIFLKKVKQKTADLDISPRNNFFEKLIAHKTGPDNTILMRVKHGNKAAEVPLLNIIPDNRDILSFYNLIIYCDEGSEITLNVLKESAALNIGSVKIIQEKNSHIKVRYLNESFESSSGVNFLKSFQDRDSTAETGIFSTLTHQNNKFFIENTLMDNAQVKYNGLFCGKHSHVDHDFQVLHNGSYSKSNISFKMAVLDNTYGIFWGDTRIIPGTAGCEGYQQNKNMVLGENARVDAIPRLEIETENVMASHGSATGEISDEEIFYLMSRGLTREDAQKLLLRGFFEDILRESFGNDPDVTNTFLEKIWSNIQNVLGMEINQ